ncbi:MAG: hypothetical protein ABGW99_03960 [Zunongwangia sp.]
MILEHNLQNDVYLVEFQKTLNNCIHPEAIISLVKQLRYFELSTKFKDKLYKTINPSSVSLKGYGDFYISLNSIKNLDDLKIDEENLIRWAYKIQVKSIFFKRFYSKVNPDKIILLSSYGFDDLYAAIYAANELGIKTIDFQHGPQTNINMAYTNWSKSPKSGFNILPKAYWNWDTNSYNNINKWAKNIDAITVKKVGHPYLEWIRNNSYQSDATGYTIIYSLQTLSLDKTFPFNLIRLIRDLNFTWVFRLHPRSPFGIDQLSEFLSDNHVNNKKYKIEASNKVPLPITLSKSFIHITNYSGCLLESNMMGVPSVIIHVLGKKLFHNYIDNDFIMYRNIQDNNSYTAIKEVIIKKSMLPNNKSQIELMNIFNPLLEK